jgi:hypothetical protein
VIVKTAETEALVLGALINMKKQILFIAAMTCLSVIAAAQTPVIAVLPFSGEDEDSDLRFTGAVTAEIARQGRYTPATAPFPADPSVSPVLLYADMIYADYAITGAASYRKDEGQYHLTLWLWDMKTGGLVCSDEMVCRDGEDMARILPLLMEWLFSRIPSGETGDAVTGAAEIPDSSATDGAGGEEPPETAAAEPAPPVTTKTPPEQPPPARPHDDVRDYWLYLGLRGGGSWRFYAEGDKSFFAGAGLLDQAPGWEGAFQASVRLLPFLALQGEAIFTQDRLSAGGLRMSSYSMMFPLLMRFIIRKNNVILSPLGGVYYILPVGDMEFSASGVSVFSPWTCPLPLGYTLGFSAGVQLGPGSLFLDLRYSGDLSAAEIDSAGGSKLYTRNRASFTLGYEFGLVNRKR